MKSKESQIEIHIQPEKKYSKAQILPKKMYNCISDLLHPAHMIASKQQTSRKQKTPQREFNLGIYKNK